MDLKHDGCKQQAVDMAQTVDTQNSEPKLGLIGFLKLLLLVLG